jgi:uncharacterized protein YndB with AHSA1/START domain
MTTSISLAQQATTVRTTFSRQTSVSCRMHASASVIWVLLTNASDYPRWNTTVTSIEGRIAPGETIRLKSMLDEKRTFKLKIKEFEPERRLAWGDKQGTRVYTLSENNDGTVTFSMTEKIGGLVFPLYARMIPAFDESFDRFAADLKKEAEMIMQTN